MRKIAKFVAVAAAMIAMTASAAALPRVGNGTTPNTWTRNIEGVLSAAKSTNLPILLCMINDHSSGEGCQHCMNFVNRTLLTDEFAAVVASHEFYMVLLNDYRTPMEPDYGGVSSELFDTYFYKYHAPNDTGYPQVCILLPNGTRYRGWSHKTVPSTNGTTMSSNIDQALSELQPKSTVIDLSSQSGTVVTVNADPTQPAMVPGTWTGVVTRSGGSGKTGTVSISLAGNNAAQYALSTGSLSWDASDGQQSFTVTGPSQMDGSIVCDTVTVNISASGFSGSTVSYGATSQTITFKDSRVKSTMAEFAAANAGLSGLSSADTWFAPAQDDGNVLEVLTLGESTLVFNATAGGILTVEPGPTGGDIVATDAEGDVQLANGQPVKFGVSAGQTISFKATAPAGAANVPVGFAQLSFQPLTVTLSKPGNGVQIPYGNLESDKSLVDMAWSANMDGCTFSLVCEGASVDMGTGTAANAVDQGFVPLSPATKTYTWGVGARYEDPEVRGAATSASFANFTVVALPIYSSATSSAVAYKSIGSQIDMSVDSTGGSAVTYSAKGLPAGMSINSATGVISGTPKKAKSYTVTVTARNANGEASVTFTLSVAKMPKTLTKPKYALFIFDGADALVANVQLSVTAAGKWNAKISEGWAKATAKGTVSILEDGSMAIASSALNLVYNPASGMWTGTDAFGRRVYGAAREKAAANWKGVWNLALASSSAPDFGGWSNVKVAGSGDIRFSGYISNKAKVSGSCYSAVFPAWFVQAFLPRWAGHGDVRFGHAANRAGVNVGCALCSDGSVGGYASFAGENLDVVEGSRWNKSFLAGLNGLTYASRGGGDVRIPVSATSSRVTAGSNGYGAKISTISSSGKLSVSYKVGGKSCKSTGVVYFFGGRSKAAGGGLQGDARFAFTIE